MNISPTGLSGVFLLEYPPFHDTRGEFIKTIHQPAFEKAGLEWKFPESFYSVSYEHVIRGMHFQYPPYDQDKLVYVIEGSILDVVLDLRNASETFGKSISVLLSSEKRNALYIKKGFAHGFACMAPSNIVEYHTSTVQDKASEGGVLYNSFAFDWTIKDPVLSDRDLRFAPFNPKQTYFP